MAAYCIGQIRIKDVEAWDKYRTQVGATIAMYGGELLFRGSHVGNFAGETLPGNVVALKFNDVDAAKRWHDSPEYQALIPLRELGADVTLVLYEG
jgi:uncharacterized protein (DUF1330 family)